MQKEVLLRNLCCLLDLRVAAFAALMLHPGSLAHMGPVTAFLGVHQPEQPRTALALMSLGSEESLWPLETWWQAGASQAGMWSDELKGCFFLVLVLSVAMHTEFGADMHFGPQLSRLLHCGATYADPPLPAPSLGMAGKQSFLGPLALQFVGTVLASCAIFYGSLCWDHNIVTRSLNATYGWCTMGVDLRNHSSFGVAGGLCRTWILGSFPKKNAKKRQLSKQLVFHLALSECNRFACAFMLNQL